MGVIVSGGGGSLCLFLLRVGDCDLILCSIDRHREGFLCIERFESIYSELSFLVCCYCKQLRIAALCIGDFSGESDRLQNVGEQYGRITLQSVGKISVGEFHDVQ